MRPKPKPAKTAKHHRDEDRRQRAVSMRVAGATYEQIGQALAISRQAAQGIVVRALEVSAAEAKIDRELLRDLELQRLDAIQLAQWPTRATPASAATLLRIGERRASLLGLDAPTQVSLVGGSDEELLAEMAQLVATATKPSE